MRLAIVDIGSNTIRGEIWDTAAFFCTFSKKVTAGLIGKMENGELSAAGIDTLVETLDSFAKMFAERGIGAEAIHLFATASLRTASNADEIVRLVRERLGLSVRVLTWEEEAAMGFNAMRLQFPGARDGLLADIGGGSTEITLFENSQCRRFVSLPIGALSLRKEHVRNAIPETYEFRAMSERVEAELLSLDWISGGRDGYAIGGSARTLARLYMMRNGIDRPLDGYAFPVDGLRGMTASMSAQQWLELIMPVAPERVHTLLPGAAIFLEVFKNIKTVTIVTQGVREGFVMSLSGGGSHAAL